MENNKTCTICNAWSDDESYLFKYKESEKTFCLKCGLDNGILTIDDTTDEIKIPDDVVSMIEI